MSKNNIKEVYQFLNKHRYCILSMLFVFFIFYSTFFGVYLIRWDSDFKYYLRQFISIAKTGKMLPHWLRQPDSDNPAFFYFWYLIARLVGDNLSNPIYSMKLVAFIIISLSFVGMNFLVTEITRSKSLGLLSGILFMVNAFSVRTINSGGMKATFASIFMLFGITFLYKFLENKNEDYFLAFLNLFVFSILSHTLTTVIFIFISVPLVLYGFKKGVHTELTKILSIVFFIIVLSLIIMSLYFRTYLSAFLFRYYKFELIFRLNKINIEEIQRMFYDYITSIFIIFSATLALFKDKLSGRKDVISLLFPLLGVVLFFLAIMINDYTAGFRMRRALRYSVAICVSIILNRKEYKHLWGVYWLCSFYILAQGLALMHAPDSF